MNYPYIQRKSLALSAFKIKIKICKRICAQFICLEKDGKITDMVKFVMCTLVSRDCVPFFKYLKPAGVQMKKLPDPIFLYTELTLSYISSPIPNEFIHDRVEFNWHRFLILLALL